MTEKLPLHERSDDEIRARADELHGQPGVIRVDDDAQVVRQDEDSDVVYVRAWIELGADD